MIDTMISWQQTEEMLGDAVEWLGAMRDREGRFLRSRRHIAAWWAGC